MRIAISSQLDEMNLSPEAYRLYLHLRCEMARQEAANSAVGGIRPDYCVNGSTLELNRKTVDILDKCRIRYGTTDASIFQFVLELIYRGVVTVQHDFILADGLYDSRIQTVTFLPEEEWV